MFMNKKTWHNKMSVVLLKQLEGNFSQKTKILSHVKSDKMFLKFTQKDKRQRIVKIFYR